MIKVNKATARKMYRSGCEIHLLPSKVRLDNEWVSPIAISLETHNDTFDRVVNRYEYYNCNAELGYYSSYYVTEHELDRYKMCQLMCM